ncbi:MAG: site-specific integrase [Anaerolineae bacterium]|nr:site-specific integrase [Anaerolineae bacterium]
MDPTNKSMLVNDLPDVLAAIGQAANHAAARHLFKDYRARRAENTLRRQDADLDLFAHYLAAVGITADRDELAVDPDAWRGITWGLAAAFVQWMLQQGYAVTSANVRLSTVKTYAKLAFQAGTLDATEYALIRAVAGYSRVERQRLDEKRAAAELPTRRAASKKAEAVRLTPAQAKALKTQPDTPQGRRDAVLMSLLLDHGLRCGEVARLDVTHVDLKSGELKFYRPKVDQEQTHRLTADARQALQAYFDAGDAPAVGKLLRGSRKDGRLAAAGMSARAITQRVQVLGADIGVVGLSAHDCRHDWATRAARKGTDPFALQEAGGWNSLAMPRRYVEAARIANEGVHLD